MTTVMFEKIKKTCRYSALSMRMIWSYGKGKMLLWLLALVVSPVVNVVSTVVNGRMLGGIGELFEGGSLSTVLVWFVLLVLIKGGDRLFSELQSKVFYKMALAADESMMLYTEWVSHPAVRKPVSSFVTHTSLSTARRLTFRPSSASRATLLR